MIRDPLLNKIALDMYRNYLLSFTIEYIIDCDILSFEDWVKQQKLFKDSWVND